MKVNRRRALLGGLGAMLGGLTLGGPRAAAQDITFFRIGTGGTAGTYFPIGGLIANAISNPPGSRTCAEGGSCGVPGLVATAVASNGSVANIAGIANGSMQSGFVQSDVAYWALNGTGIYEGRPKVDVLRSIATLYPESFHLVARKGAGIKSMKDLKGMRMSLDEPGSGTLVDARIILAAYGMTEKDIKAEYLKPQQSADKFKDGALDAFFSVAGWPEGAIAELAATTGIDLVPIDGPEVEKLIKQYSFFAAEEIPDGAYKNVGRGEDRQRQRDLGDLEQAARPDDLQRHRRAVEFEHTQAARFRSCQGPGDKVRIGAAGPWHPAASRCGDVLSGEGPPQVRS